MHGLAKLHYFDMQIFQVNINLTKDRPLFTLPQCDSVNRGLTLVRLSEHSTYTSLF